MKLRNLKFTSFAFCTVLVVGLSASAFASCGDSLSAMAAAVSGPSRPMQQGTGFLGENAGGSSIVGLWYVEFAVNGTVIQDAYQIWNSGGTEVHNPNVDPRGGNVCLGTWKRVGEGVYKLNHRVWNYDTNGNFLGTIHLSETVTLGNGGCTHSGTVVLNFYDPSGNLLTEVDATVSGKRIAAD